MVAGPENQWTFDDIPSVAQALSKNKLVVWITATRVEAAEQAGGEFIFLPAKTFAEKSGSFVNFEGKEQKFEKVSLFVDQALSLSEMAAAFKGEFVKLDKSNPVERVNNEFVHERREVSYQY